MNTCMGSTAESPAPQNWSDDLIAAEKIDTVFLNRQGPGPALCALWTEKTAAYEKTPPTEPIMGEFRRALDLYFGGDMEASIALSGPVAAGSTA